MRPKNKGWIKDYAQYLQSVVLEMKYGDQLKSMLLGQNYDENLYRLIQPTGLMYGHPIQHPGAYDVKMKSWDEKEKLAFILFDSFLHNSFLINEIHNKSDIRDLVYESAKELILFYQSAYPNIDLKKREYFGRRRNELLLAESLIQSRISVKSGLRNNFWGGFFYNSLLFLDVYFFGQWMQRKNGVAQLEDFDKQQERIRLCILKTIASASQSDRSIDFEERKLYKFFLQSAALSCDSEKEAMEYLNDKIDITQLDFPEMNSWVLRKYLLELAALTIWSDKEVKESEKDFLKKLSKRLRISDQEKESSLLAIESFVITNWEEVHFLQSRHNFHIVRDRFSNRLGKMLIKNKKAVEKEIRESRELMILIHKATKETLSEEEKIKVKAQLLDVLKTIPTFVIIALPFTFITLPLLIKMLPKSAFPSAFSDEE